MTKADALELVSRYRPLLKTGGRAVFIAPQESGFRSDPTHVEFSDFAALRQIARECGLAPVREYSFPLPRYCGTFFRYNEFVSISVKEPTRTSYSAGACRLKATESSARGSAPEPRAAPTSGKRSRRRAQASAVGSGIPRGWLLRGSGLPDR